MVTTEPATPTVAEMEQVTREKLMEDLRTVFVDVEELLKATASQTGDRITAARAKAEESLKVAKARLAEWVELAENRLAGTHVRVYLCGGNDDTDEVLTALDVRDDQPAVHGWTENEPLKMGSLLAFLRYLPALRRFQCGWAPGDISFTGTNTGPLGLGGMEIPATGKGVVGQGSYFVRLKDGKITEFSSHPDVAGMMVQLGLIGSTAEASTP